MSYEAFVGETFDIHVESATTGLADIEIAVTKPDGSAIANLATTEIGSSKVYKGTLTPADEGTYVLQIISPTDTTIAGRKKPLISKPVSKFDLGGSGFNSATDSLAVLSDKLDNITANQSSGQNGFLD